MRRAIRRKLFKLHNLIYDKPLPAATEQEKMLSSELKERFKAISPIELLASTPDSEREWQRNMNRLRELVLSEDTREFLRWDVIGDTMFATDAGYLKNELNYLQKLPNWKSVWMDVIKEVSIGHPVPCFYYPSSSGNLIHHAYHGARFQEASKINFDSLGLVFEFGGGYGSLCRVIHKLQFKGIYIIFDLPHFSELQKYFLKSLSIPILDANSLGVGSSGVCCVSDIKQLKKVIETLSSCPNKMFCATWSLSETPLSLRAQIEPLITEFNRFLIAYQHQFNEVNNVDYFHKWQQIDTVKWCDVEINHIPGNRYLFGYEH